MWKLSHFTTLLYTVIPDDIYKSDIAQENVCKHTEYRDWLKNKQLSSRCLCCSLKA